MNDIVKITALGGLDESGRDCYVVEINDDIFVLDCGMGIPDKNIPGIDGILPNGEYLIANKNRVKAYILTHGHDESMSGLKFFYEQAPAPIYCTHATRVFLESESNIFNHKIQYVFVEVNPSSELIISNRKVKFFQTSHNAAFSFGVAISTDKGNIVYTSDFIVEYSARNPAYLFDLKGVSDLAEEETYILLAESKTAHIPGYCAPKHRGRPLIEKYFKANKRIFVNCFWQNYFRISEIFALCREYKKRVYLYNDFTSKTIDNFLKILPNAYDRKNIILKEDLLRVRSSDVVVLMIGQGEELYTELTQIVEERNEDKRIRFTPDDIFINIAIPTVNLETVATRNIDNVYRSGCEVVWVKKKMISSMHACQDDLKYFLSALKPKYYLPVRGSFTHMMDNAKLAVSMSIGLNHNNIFILDNGMQLLSDPVTGRFSIVPNSVNKINVQPVLLDGKGTSKAGKALVEQRKELANDGVVIVALTVSTKEKKVIAGPDCQMRGFVYVKEAEPLLKTVSNYLVSEVNAAFDENRYDKDEISKNVIEKSRRFIKRDNGREPLIIPIIVEIN